ncbi:hypothetical protein [Rugamonas apoptosis]|uniref:UrcA family protein n=1 Tax=Rugamonas apoptosis TaxID=2758570 RepID=A0A7W2F7X6_9BURK|nr:hypothetical protein [Rugamonas apoptosis]MBA5686750.1 hypothetical protein [Rugamonas apoptosis]
MMNLNILNPIARAPLRVAPLLFSAMLGAAAYAQTTEQPRDAMPPAPQTTPVTPPADLPAVAPTQDNAPAAATVQESTPGVTPPAVAQQQKKEIAHGDPGRWYQHDSTPADQLRIVRKEIAAALQEATLACKKQPAAERNACLKEARSTYRHDMVNAKLIRDENNRLE